MDYCIIKREKEFFFYHREWILHNFAVKYQLGESMESEDDSIPKNRVPREGKSLTEHKEGLKARKGLRILIYLQDNQGNKK